MEHDAVDPTWSNGLPPPFRVGLLAIQCFCGPLSSCQDGKCPCVAVGVVCDESRCGCPCCIFPGVFSADTGTQRLCRHGHFCERATRKYAESEEQHTFNPNAKSEDKAEAKNAAAVAQKCMIASGVSQIIEKDCKWLQCQLLPRKQLQDVLAGELTLAGFRVNLTQTAQHGYNTLFAWAKYAHTVHTPEYVQYQIWNGQLAVKLTKNQRTLWALQLEFGKIPADGGTGRCLPSPDGLWRRDRSDWAPLRFRGNSCCDGAGHGRHGIHCRSLFCVLKYADADGGPPIAMMCTARGGRC